MRATSNAMQNGPIKYTYFSCYFVFESCGQSIHQLYSIRLCTVKCSPFGFSVNVNQITANFRYQFDNVKFYFDCFCQFSFIANILVVDLKNIGWKLTESRSRAFSFIYRIANIPHIQHLNHEHRLLKRRRRRRKHHMPGDKFEEDIYFMYAMHRTLFSWAFPVRYLCS